MFLGNLVIYAIGLPWLGVVTSSTPGETIALGLTPFLLGDALKLVLAAVLFPVAWWVVGRRPDDR
jgi:biotin transport system substrate-specific component